MGARRWTIDRAVGLRPAGELVAVVGGGGKTSLIFALAAALPGRVVVTTTTRIFAAQQSLAPAVCHAADLSQLGALLDAHRICLVVGDVTGDKATGVDPALPAALLARPDVDTVLVEADGSRMRPFKAPADHEPVIPDGTTLVIPVAGLDALEQALDRAAHRPDRVAHLLKLPAGEPVASHQLTPAEMAAVLTHAEGGLKGAADNTRAVLFLNKVETAARREAAAAVAHHALASPMIERVVAGALQRPDLVEVVYQRLTAVVLAAGEASRMGRNKLALPWGEGTVLGQTLATLQDAGLADILVVTGNEAAHASDIANRAGAPSIHHPHYKRGMLSSLQAGVDALPAACAAVLVVLGDQPMVASSTIRQLVEAWQQHDAGLVAPVYDQQRGNPVLIARRHFAELLALPEGAAPRDLVRRHADDLLLVPVSDPAIHRDLDRPDDYLRWRPHSE